MEDSPFHVTEQFSALAFENIRNSFKSWCAIYGIDPFATKFIINAGRNTLLLRFYNKSNKSH